MGQFLALISAPGGSVSRAHFQGRLLLGALGLLSLLQARGGLLAETGGLITMRLLHSCVGRDPLNRILNHILLYPIYLAAPAPGVQARGFTDRLSVCLSRDDTA